MTQITKGTEQNSSMQCLLFFFFRCLHLAGSTCPFLRFPSFHYLYTSLQKLAATQFLPSHTIKRSPSKKTNGIRSGGGNKELTAIIERRRASAEGFQKHTYTHIEGIYALAAVLIYWWQPWGKADTGRRIYSSLFLLVFVMGHAVCV